MHVKYNTKGTCAVRIEFDVENLYKCVINHSAKTLQ